MKPSLLLAAFLALGSAQAPAQGNQEVPPPAPAPAATSAEQTAIMDRIERDIRLPEGALPLASYARYYAWQQRSDGLRKVIGVYVRLEDHTPGRYWVGEDGFPLIMDGGCSLIGLSYNVAEQRIEHVTCNGEA